MAYDKVAVGIAVAKFDTTNRDRDFQEVDALCACIKEAHLLDEDQRPSSVVDERLDSGVDRSAYGECLRRWHVGRALDDRAEDLDAACATVTNPQVTSVELSWSERKLPIA